MSGPRPSQPEGDRARSHGPEGPLSGRRAVVTGAASGIGRAIAARLLADGAHVALVDVDEAALTTACDPGNPRALRFVADVSIESAVAEAMERAAQQFGGLDIVVANAGIEPIEHDRAVHELDLATWRRVLDVNLTGAFLSCKHGVRALLNTGGGAVVITGSPTGMNGFALGQHAYSASKAGCHGLARVMAAEYASRGIRVNALIPGYTRTGLTKDLIEDEQRHGLALESIPMRRPAEPEEIAALAAWLVSDQASYATGGLFVVDGGQTAI